MENNKQTYTVTDLRESGVDWDRFCGRCKHQEKLEKKEYPCYICRGGYPSYLRHKVDLKPYKFVEK